MKKVDCGTRRATSRAGYRDWETPQELKHLNFQIVNLQGQAIIQEDIQVNGVLFEREIEVNSWSSGAYWVNFKNGAQQIGRKLIIIK